MGQGGDKGNGGQEHGGNGKEIIDLEELAKAGKPVPPHAKHFKIKIDKQKYEVSVPSMTGRELLVLGGKTPPEQYTISEKLKGGQTKKIGLDDRADFTAPGIEKFMTLPLDQTEGLTVRRQFELPEEDREYLDALGLTWETVVDGNVQWVIVNDFPLPEGYAIQKAAAAVRLQQGYPDVEIDMVFFFPAVTRADKQLIKATDGTANLDGKTWQQWSRHRTPQNRWRPGVDGLATHFEQVRHWLEKEVLGKRS